MTGVSRKDRIQSYPNIVSVENLHTSDFPGDNVEYAPKHKGCAT
jgi:hypothetical protein